MAVDWETNVGAPNVALFGESALYYPAAGGAPIPIVGVFDAAYRETAMLDGLAYTSDSQPVLGVNVSQFGGLVPAQSDRLILTDPLSRFYGFKFIVREPRPDSHGMVLLMLNSYSGALP